MEVARLSLANGSSISSSALGDGNVGASQSQRKTALFCREGILEVEAG